MVGIAEMVLHLPFERRLEDGREDAFDDILDFLCVLGLVGFHDLLGDIVCLSGNHFAFCHVGKALLVDARIELEINQQTWHLHKLLYTPNEWIFVFGSAIHTALSTMWRFRFKRCIRHRLKSAMQSGSISSRIRSISASRTASDSVGWAHRRRKRIPMHQRRAIAYGSSMWIISIRLLSVIGLQHSRVPYTDSGR